MAPLRPSGESLNKIDILCISILFWFWIWIFECILSFIKTVKPSAVSSISQPHDVGFRNNVDVRGRKREKSSFAFVWEQLDIPSVAFHISNQLPVDHRSSRITQTLWSTTFDCLSVWYQIASKYITFSDFNEASKGNRLNYLESSSLSASLQPP